jgi:hypothetical protein
MSNKKLNIKFSNQKTEGGVVMGYGDRGLFDDDVDKAMGWVLKGAFWVGKLIVGQGINAYKKAQAEAEIQKTNEEIPPDEILSKTGQQFTQFSKTGHRKRG